MIAIELAEIAAGVRAQMATYVDIRRTSAMPAGPVGSAWPIEDLERDLEAMRQALIDPYWLEATVGVALLGQAERVERCVVVAEDRHGHLLAYVPSQDEFSVLRQYQPGKFGSFGLDGDAVGAFISI